MKIKFCSSYALASSRFLCPSKLSIFLTLLLSTAVTNANTYHLEITEKSINLIGELQNAILANDSLPAPTLHWREGEIVTLQVSNNLTEPTSIHWHGIVLPYQMDGVPGISFPGIAAGQTFTYQFQVKQSGTYWYHGHSAMQEQQGLFGALVIDSQHNPYPVQRDYVILLSDWPEADPHRTLARLKKQSDYYNFQKRTIVDLFQDIKQIGLSATISDRLDWGEMRMEPTDLADVTGATYHFLVNGQTPEQNWIGLFKGGEKVRLRFINASAMTHFDVRIPGLKMKVIAADGQDVMPVNVDEFRIAVAETYDVIVEPSAEQAYSVFAEAMDRSGYASATLTPRPDLTAVLPTMRPRTLLTMADMGEEHSSHQQHSSHNNETNITEKPVEKHSLHTVPPSSNEPMSHAGHNMMDMPTSEHSNHAMPSSDNMQHEGHNMADMPEAAIESYPQLSYQHLKALHPADDWKAPNREITLRLTGNMRRYIWSFDDVKYSQSEPIRVKFGDRIRFHYVNETMMNHPIHLHGLWQYLDNGNGVHNPKKHVINVKPGQTVTVDVLADAEGEWAFHCHLLYHMDTGMFRKFIVEKTAER
jgi:CopA family copper-resistance protein